MRIVRVDALTKFPIVNSDFPDCPIGITYRNFHNRAQHIDDGDLIESEYNDHQMCQIGILQMRFDIGSIRV